jgi:hypothetical protein
VKTISLEGLLRTAQERSLFVCGNRKRVATCAVLLTELHIDSLNVLLTVDKVFDVLNHVVKFLYTL